MNRSAVGFLQVAKSVVIANTITAKTKYLSNLTIMRNFQQL